MKKSRKILLPFSCFLLLNLFSMQRKELPPFALEATKSVVTIITYDQKNQEIQRGKGVIISKDGLILTNYHLLSHAPSAKIEFLKGKIKPEDFDVGFSQKAEEGTEKKPMKTKAVPVREVGILDKQLDLALVKIKEKKLVPAQLQDSTAFAMGEKLIWLNQGAVADGTATQVQELLKAKSVLQSTFPPDSTMSGGPIFDSEGKVLGILTSVTEKTHFIIPIAYAIPLIESTKFMPLLKHPQEDYFATGEGLYLKGVAYLLEDKYLDAVNYFEQVVQFEPGKAEAHAHLGHLYTLLGKRGKALNAYQTASRFDPNNHKTYFSLGMIYLKSKQFKEAIPPFTQCRSLKPDFPDVFYNLGLAYEGLGELENAAGAYQEFIKINPGPSWTGYNQLGSVYVQLGQYEKAIETFQKVLETNPSDIKANYNLAFSYDMSGQYDQAVPLYRKLIELNPKDAKSYYDLLFRLYDKSGQYENAIEACTEIIKLFPDSATDHYNMGIMYFKLQNHEKALEVFHQVLALSPNFDAAYYNIGLVHFKQKKFAEAIQAFTKFTELKPDNADAYYNIGAGYLQLKKYEKALKPLQQVIELKPDYALAHYNLAIVYFVLGDQFSANDEHKKLRSLDPELAAKLGKIIHR